MLAAQLSGICSHSPKCTTWQEHEEKLWNHGRMKPVRDPDEVAAEAAEQHREYLATLERERRKEEVERLERAMKKFEGVLRELCPNTQIADEIMNAYVKKYLTVREHVSCGCTRCGATWETHITSRFCPICGSSNEKQGYVFEVVKDGT